jgi:hypothetical protein
VACYTSANCESHLASAELSEGEFEPDMALQWSFERSIIDLLVHGAEVKRHAQSQGQNQQLESGRDLRRYVSKRS